MQLSSVKGPLNLGNTLGIGLKRKLRNVFKHKITRGHLPKHLSLFVSCPQDSCNGLVLTRPFDKLSITYTYDPKENISCFGFYC